MTQLLFLYWTAFLVGLSGAMMPGPVLTMTISETMKRGFRAGPLIVLGHAILEMALLAAIVAGLGKWLLLPLVKTCLALGGGALLILMGGQMIWTARRAVEQALGTQAAESAAVRGPILAGILTSVSNPYWAIWWATTGLYYASMALEKGLPGLSAFYSGHISSDLVWYSLVAGAVASGRRLCPPAVYRGLIIICGLGLMVLGGWFCYSGAGNLI